MEATKKAYEEGDQFAHRSDWKMGEKWQKPPRSRGLMAGWES